MSLLLFLQWPLREWVQAYSREANDLAQALFALYVALAVTAATRRHAHLAADAFARRYGPATRARASRASPRSSCCCRGRCSCCGRRGRSSMQSMRQLESFPDTFNPGYFLLKAAVVLLAVAVALQALVVALGGTDPGDG